MASAPKPRLTQVALFTRDLEKMVDSYTNILGLTVTDQGEARSAPVQMVFVSSDPGEHHQFVLVEGRADPGFMPIAEREKEMANTMEPAD